MDEAVSSTTSPTFRILSIDGGGIRGIIAAHFLAALEERAKQPLGHCFDLITGTSTGGIIALALGMQIPAAKVRDLYVSRGAEIFQRRRSKRLATKLLRWSLPGPSYSNVALGQEIRSLLGKHTIGDSVSRRCIPAVNVRKGLPRVIKTDHHRDFITDWKYPAWEAAMATSAAPTFFPAYQMQPGGAMVDGGLWANNPSLVGVAEGLRLDYQLSAIELLSVGTGKAGFSMTAKAATRAGRVRWMWKARLIEILMGTQAAAVENQISYLPLGKYLRADVDLAQGKFKLDDISRIDALRGEADNLVRQRLNEASEFVAGPSRPAWPRVGRDRAAT